MTNPRKIRIGTRGSALALAQARLVRARLAAAKGCDEDAFDIRVISTAGDRIQDRPLSEVGGKGLFSKEIETALSAGKIDLAVHSTKDMASHLPDGLILSAYLEREDVRDAFLSPVAGSIRDLPQGAVVGSSSLRRQALIKRMRPDIEVVVFRGNVQTRLLKLENGQVAATLLAQAGLVRLDLGDKATALLPVKDFPPAPGQGAICIETRADDGETAHLVRLINHEETELAMACERAYLAALDGSCRTPIAGFARRAGEVLQFDCMILSVDGQTVFEMSATSEPTVEAATAMGRKAGEVLRERAGDDFFHHWT